MPKTTPEKAPKKPTARSRLTNGKLGDMDGRGKWARRLSDLIELYSQDVTTVPAALPHSVQSLIRRAATLTVELERAEAGYAKDGGSKATDLEAYQRTANTLTRLLGAVQAKMGLTEHLDRPAGGRGAILGHSRFIQSVHSTFTVADWRLAYGNDDTAVRRSLARSVAFSIELAKRSGSPLSDELANFAVDNGFAEYAEDQADTIEHEGPATAAPARDVITLSIANDNGWPSDPAAS